MSLSDFVIAGTGPRKYAIESVRVVGRAYALVGARLAERRAICGSSLVVMSGGAEGWDEIVACAAIELGIRLHVALPTRWYVDHYLGAHSLTGRDRRPEFRYIWDYAERIVIVDELDSHRIGYGNANYARNAYMVTGSITDGFRGADDFLVGGPVPATSFGTARTIRLIKAAGKWQDDMAITATAGGAQ